MKAYFLSLSSLMAEAQYITTQKRHLAASSPYGASPDIILPDRHMNVTMNGV